jgi:hypothetical protein
VPNEEQQPVKHNEFHLQLDAVNHRLVCRLDLEVVQILSKKKAYVEQHNQDVDHYEVSDHFALRGPSDREDGLESVGRFPDVKT